MGNKLEKQTDEKTCHKQEIKKLDNEIDEEAY